MLHIHTIHILCQQRRFTLLLVFQVAFKKSKFCILPVMKVCYNKLATLPDCHIWKSHVKGVRLPLCYKFYSQRKMCIHQTPTWLLVIHKDRRLKLQWGQQSTNVGGKHFTKQRDPKMLQKRGTQMAYLNREKRKQGLCTASSVINLGKPVNQYYISPYLLTHLYPHITVSTERQ